MNKYFEYFEKELNSSFPMLSIKYGRKVTEIGYDNTEELDLLDEAYNEARKIECERIGKEFILFVRPTKEEREERLRKYREEMEKTKQEILDKMLHVVLNDLTDKDKEYILEHPKAIYHHHGLGTWIRNEYVHNNKLEDRFSIEIGDVRMCPDDISDLLIEEIIKVLQSEKEE